jgi:hypothetical protein
VATGANGQQPKKWKLKKFTLEIKIILTSVERCGNRRKRATAQKMEIKKVYLRNKNYFNICRTLWQQAQTGNSPKNGN